jgi:hypothetical protein
VLEKVHHGVRKGVEVMRVDQQPGLPVLNLVLDAAHPAGNNRPSFPHRLGNGQPKALCKALLDDHGSQALQRIHHRGVLGRIVHREGSQMHAVVQVTRHGVAMRDDLLEDLQPLRVVAHRRHGGPASTRCAFVRRAIPCANASSTPEGSLRLSQRDTCTRYGSTPLRGGELFRSARRSMRPGLPSAPHEDRTR